jgi:hypothetical protein
VASISCGPDAVSIVATTVPVPGSMRLIVLAT